jgi:P27 family predicted phage terminase small subunit
MPAHRKPKALHELHSSTPHDRASDTSHVPAGRPRIPKDVGPGLRSVFKKLCAILQERRVLTAGDAELIRLYVFQYDRHVRNAALLREEGELVTYFRLDSNGQSVPQVRTNLRLKIVTDTERQMAAILNQLGLTPTAKDRAKPTSGTPADEIIPGSLADYQQRGEFLFNVVPMRTPIAPPDVIEEDAPPTEETDANGN